MSNGQTIDSLNIEITADASKAQKSLQSFSRSISSLNKNISNFSNNDNLSKGLKNISMAMGSLGDSLRKVNTSKMKEFSSAMSTLGGKNASNASNNIPQLSKTVSEFMDTMSKAPEVSKNTTQLVFALSQLAKQSKALKGSTSGIKENFGATSNVAKDVMPKKVGETAPKLDKAGVDNVGVAAEKSKFKVYTLGEKVNELKQQLRDLDKQGISFGTPKYDAIYAQYTNLKGVLENYKKSLVGTDKATRKTSKGTFNLGNALKSLGKELNNAKNKFKQFTHASNKSNFSLKKGFTTFLRYGFGIRSLFVLFNKIRSAFSEGTMNLAHYSSAYNKELSKLKGSLLMLKNAFAVAFKPIIEVVAPYLSLFIQKIAQALNYVAQFFGALMGKKSVTQAVAVVDNFADSSDKARESAKKLLGLQGFDKLNNLTTSNSGSGSGNNSGVKYEDMFTESEVSQSAKDLAEKFKQAWANADFTDIGKDLGTNIKNALESIKWEDVKAGAEKVGKSTATFINGFVESGVLETLGKTVGESINTALHGVDAFLVNTDWKNLGSEVSKSIETAFKTVEWSKVGKTIGDFVASAMDLVSGLINGIDWKNLPSNIVKSIKDTLTGVDWANLFGSWGNLAGSVLKAIWNLRKGCFEVMGNVAEGIKDYFVEQFEKAGFDKDNSLLENGVAIIKGVFNGVIGFMKKIGSWIYENVIKPFADGFFDGDAVEKLKGIGKDIWDKISSGFKALGDFALGVGITILEGGKQSLEWVSEKWNGLKDKAIELVANAKEKVGGALSKLQSGWDAIKSKSAELVADAKEKAKSKLATLKAGWDAIKTRVATLTGDAKNNKSAVLSTLKAGWDAVKTKTATLTGTAKNTASSVLQKLKDGWTTVSSKTSTLTAKFQDYFSSAFKKMVNGLIDGINFIIRAINKLPGISIKELTPIKAKGGVFNNGNWKPIQAYAGGGEFNSGGQLFIAREAGPELVGNLGGHTAVMNNDQIVASVSAGVYQAVKSAMGNGSNVTVVLEGDAQGLFKAVRNQDRQYANINGHSAFVY